MFGGYVPASDVKSSATSKHPLTGKKVTIIANVGAELDGTSFRKALETAGGKATESIKDELGITRSNKCDIASKERAIGLCSYLEENATGEEPVKDKKKNGRQSTVPTGDTNGAAS